MTIPEILKLLPASEAERVAATTPQCPAYLCRQRLFEARSELEKLLLQTGRPAVADIMDMLPSDGPHLEQVISAAEGQQVVRERIATARKLLENLE